jgi:hypothetical protein
MIISETHAILRFWYLIKNQIKIAAKKAIGTSSFFLTFKHKLSASKEEWRLQ